MHAKRPCAFIQYPYAAVHFDVPIEELYQLRQELLKEKKTQFCCFVASGTIGELAVRRMALFQQIDKWKPVHSAGKVLNNVSYLAPGGLDFLRWISRLTDEPISRISFEEGFRKLLRDVSGSK